MGFFNRLRQGVLKAGRKVKQMVGTALPYLKAAGRTVLNNPQFIPQVAGLLGGGVALAGQIGAGALTGGATAIPAIGTASALLAGGVKTAGDISAAFRRELAAGRKKKSNGGLKISADDVSKLKEATAQFGKAKKIYKDSSMGANINE